MDHYVKCRWAAPAATATAGESKEEEGQCSVLLVLQDMPCICHCGMHFSKCWAARLNYMTQIAIAATRENRKKQLQLPHATRAALQRPRLTLCAPLEINICTQNAIFTGISLCCVSVCLCTCVYLCVFCPFSLLCIFSATFILHFPFSSLTNAGRATLNAFATSHTFFG